MRDRFARFAAAASRLTGTYWAFLIAAAVIVVWALCGPVFGYSDTWQLVINTGTTIVTFLMVFLIQNSQNRESRATQLKLDELIRSIQNASDRFIDIEGADEEDLERLQEIFRRRAEKIRNNGTENSEEEHEDEEQPLGNRNASLTG
ncbi:MAG TPA: low affinity iron permease family protein [Nitrolancea sp.]|nr:low affinity iron permease family protein [Nitrolancea sp.]